MAYRVKKPAGIARQVRRIAREQIDRAVEQLTDPTRNRHQAIHQVRKHFKKIRGLVRLVRPGLEPYREINAWYRDAGRELSRLRDAEAVLETVEKLTATAECGNQTESGVFESLIALLRQRRRRVVEEWTELDNQVELLIVQLGQQRQSIASWTFVGNKKTRLFRGFQDTYCKARKSLWDLSEEATDEQWHQCRKYCKYHWYHLRLLRNVWPTLLRPHIRAIRELTELLGDDHDLVVLGKLLVDAQEKFQPSLVTAVAEPVREQRRRLQAESLRRGRQLFAEPPAAFRRRLQACWKVWKSS